MALAGYDAETSMDMLPTVLDLAAAGGMDLATASDMVTDAQSALGLSLDETRTMVDQMAMTASKSNTSVAQLGDAILTVGGTAQFMSGGTEELTQVLGLLADNGIKASEGGTHLRNMLLKLASPTEAGAAALEGLGVNIFDAEGKMRSFSEIFPELQGAMSDLTDEEQLQKLSDIFNTRDIAAAQALLGTSVDRWGELAGAIDGAAGSAADMAAIQLDNLAGDVTIFQSALEGAKIAVSDQLTPALRGFVQFGTEGLQKVTQAFKTDGLEGAMQALGKVLSDGLKQIVQMAPEMVKAAGELLGALGKGFMDSSDVIIQAMLEVGELLLQGIFQHADDVLQAGITLLGKLVLGIGQALPDLIPAAVSMIVELVDTLYKPENLDMMVDAAIAIIEGLTEGIVNAIPILIERAPEIITRLLSTLIEEAPRLLDAGVEAIFQLVDALTDPDNLLSLLEAGVNLIVSICEAATKALPELFELGKKIVLRVWDGIKEKWSWIADSWKNLWSGLTTTTTIETTGTTVGGGRSIDPYEQTFALASASNSAMQASWDAIAGGDTINVNISPKNVKEFEDLVAAAQNERRYIRMG